MKRLFTTPSGWMTIGTMLLLGLVFYLHEFHIVSDTFRDWCMINMIPAIVIFMRQGQDHACATANAQQTKTLTQIIEETIQNRLESRLDELKAGQDQIKKEMP